MSALHVVRPDPKTVTLQGLLRLLSPAKFTEIEATAKIMRESFQCPYTVADYEEFKDTILAFYAHYNKAFFNAPITTNQTWRDFAYEFAQKNLTKYNPSLKQRHARDLHEYERNAITGRNGGMIGVIDAFTDAIIKLHKETYINGVYVDNIASSDYDTQLRLADEMLKKYGGYLFPGEPLMPHYMVGFNFPELFTSFVMHINEIRQEWQY